MVAHSVLGYLVRRTRDPELGADLTAETFARALEGVRASAPTAAPRSTGSVTVPGRLAIHLPDW